jgi:AraC family transcriptional regulator, regulatory protein of adaptative response / methylated-DNA-[protein]-cysteine methyltransferase
LETQIATHQPEMQVDRQVLWNAVLRRDATYDGQFVYGVRSTGIFCRPTCPSKRPEPKQVAFFSLPQAAQRAGFRPCRRCAPLEKTGNPHTAVVREVCRLIEEQGEETPTLQTLAVQVGLSPHYLQRVFKRTTGITPRQYADARRLDQFKTALKSGDSVTTALYDAGYGSSSRLYEQTPRQLGMTPTTYQRGGLGMRIAYTIVDSQLGRVLVAATDKGICAVYLGDSDDFLVASLKQEFSRAELTNEGSKLTEWVSAIVSHLAGNQPQLDLPLDVKATTFQRRVWEQLQAIPYGSTRSYGEIARVLGQPSATRAVARACATNPASVVIPCHRVVREDGQLAGYRWGLKRKRALLDQEQALSQGLNEDDQQH